MNSFGIDIPLLDMEETPSSYQENVHKAFEPTFKQFDRTMKRYALFNIFFFVLCSAEVTFLILSFGFLAQSLILSFSLAVLFFTFFAYFTSRVYFQTKKPEQLKGIRNDYISSCKSLLSYHEGIADHHVALANACCKLANRLHGREYNYYTPPKWLKSFAPLMEKISCWWSWQDVHFMKELLLQTAVDEHVKLVKCEPTSLQSHAALANAYVMLSGLYIDPRNLEGYDDERWIPEEKYTEAVNEKFRWTAERAIEEFKILSEYAPDDPWVHSQLAYSYHDLQMPLEEIAEYETIQKLTPNDRDNLYRLGVLYFQHGFNAKGLRVYEELKNGHYKKADLLIKYYASYQA